MRLFPRRTRRPAPESAPVDRPQTDYEQLAIETLYSCGTPNGSGLAAEIERGRAREISRRRARRADPTRASSPMPDVPRRASTLADDVFLLASGAHFGGGVVLPTGRVASPGECCCVKCLGARTDLREKD
jgi:hypothetical protein